MRLEFKEISEYRDFGSRMRLNKADWIEFGELALFITKIGEQTGATSEKFKKEWYADRFLLPEYLHIHSGEPNDFGLRLYCYRYSDEVVFIYNGDRKTVEGEVRACPRCKPHFEQANKITKALKKAISEGRIEITGFIIEQDEDFNLEI